MPARGPEPISARSLAIFVSETATTFSAPDSSTSASRLACASNGSSGARTSKPRPSESFARDALGELRVRVQPGAGRGPAERDLRDLRQRVLDAPAAEPDLRRVAGELLAERDRDRVHQVRAAGLDDVLERLGLGGERAPRAARARAAAGSWPPRARRGGRRRGRRRSTTGPCSRGRSRARRRPRASRSPRWRSCSSRCRSRSGRRRSGTGRRGRRRRSRPRRPRSARRPPRRAGRARR